MKYNRFHYWNVDSNKAISIQYELSKKLILKNDFIKIKTIAGCDVAYSSYSNKAYAAICILTFPELNRINEIISCSKVSFPYISGLLTFREGPVLLKAFDKMKLVPDVILFNGQGIAHPIKMGLASHMGIILDVASIGCTQRVLFGSYNNPDNKKGFNTEIMNSTKDVIGACLRIKKNVKSIFISQGHKIDLKTAINTILKCVPKYKIPEPIRAAHILANSMKNKV